MTVSPEGDPTLRARRRRDLLAVLLILAGLAAANAAAWATDWRLGAALCGAVLVVLGAVLGIDRRNG